MDWPPVPLTVGNMSQNDSDGVLLEYYRRHLADGARLQYQRDVLSYYLMGIGGITICCLGFVGNILSLIVLTRKTMRSSTYSYLSAIAVCDSLVLIFTFVLLAKDVKQPPQLGRPHWSWDDGLLTRVFPYVHPLAFTFQVTSIWLTLAFTVDRYIMICHPFRAEPLCTVPRARRVIAGLYVLAAAFNIPKFFEYQIVNVTMPDRNETHIGCDLTYFGDSQLFRELYHSWFYIAFVCGVPFIVLAVLNAILMYTVHLSRRRGKQLNMAERKRNDTTIMLISVVVVFFACQATGLVSRVMWAFERDMSAFKRLPLYTLNEVGNFMIILNSAVNIVPYYFFGVRFRRQFWRLFCRCLFHYKRFRRLDRSYSLTAVETRRSSVGATSQTRLRPSLTPTDEWLVNGVGDKRPRKHAEVNGNCNETNTKCQLLTRTTENHADQQL